MFAVRRIEMPQSRGRRDPAQGTKLRAKFEGLMPLMEQRVTSELTDEIRNTE
jgi:hypothetical protein